MGDIERDEREKQMLDVSKQVADFAYKQGVGEAVAVDHLIRDYRATAEQLRAAVGAAVAVLENARPSDGPVALVDRKLLDALRTALGGAVGTRCGT